MAEARMWNGSSWVPVTDEGHRTASDPHPGYATDTDLATHAAAADPHPGYATDTDLSTHVAAADPHTGYQKESEKNVASGYAGLNSSSVVVPNELGTGTMSSGTVLAGTDIGSATWRALLDADIPAAIARDSEVTTAVTTGVATHTAAADPHTGYLQESVISGLATPAIILGSAAAAGTTLTPIRSDATIAAFDATAPSTQAFSDAAAVGAAAFAARRDHKHAMPADPVVAHAAAADPHTGYQKESEKAAANGYAGLDAGAKVPVAQLGGGTASTTTFLRGDQSWGTPSVTGGHTHDGTGGATSLVVGGTAEAGAAIPVASTVGAIAMGDYANAGTGTNPIAMGSGANALNAPQATGAGSICLGANTATTATVGSDEGPRASGLNSIAIGSSASGRPAAAAAGTDSIAIGFSAQAVFTNCVAIGSLAIAGTATKQDGVAIGHSATAQAAASVAIGVVATANFDNSVAIGPHSMAYAANQINLCGAGSPVSSVSTLRLQQPCLATAPVDAEICASAFTVWCNEAGNVLTFRVKYAGGTLKTGTIALV